MKHISWVSASGLILLLLMIPLFMMMLNPTNMEENAFHTQDKEEIGTIMVSKEVERYRPLFEKYAKKYGVEKLVNILMALTMQESGGRVPDVMQSSESLGLPPNTITDPEQSIDAGVRHFKAVYTSAKSDVDLALQAYNFGGGFITWVQNGKGGQVYVKSRARI
ncbi:lysozyme family protein [Listeria floridensis]|uniref:lysozyme family protein n=1 Tax=Listeria floridensis TaxID=1494962 RepID=UPI002688B4D7